MIRTKTMILASLAAMSVAAIGCSAADSTGTGPSATDPGAKSLAGDESVGSTAEAWTATVPTSGLTPVASVVVNGCTFTVGYGPKTGTLPPQNLVYVQKTGVSRISCPSARGFTAIGSTYGTPSLSITKHPSWPFIIASYTTKGTPSGEAHTLVGIAQVSFGTGAILRTAGLAAMSPGISQPQLGNVTSAALSLDASGNLTATGAFNGVIPGATGSGSSYTAVWANFIWDVTPNPPATITLF